MATVRITHIQSVAGRFNDADYSMCGRYLPMRFKFLNVEHARAEVQREGRLVPCLNCLKSKEAAVNSPP